MWGTRWLFWAGGGVKVFVGMGRRRGRKEPSWWGRDGGEGAVSVVVGAGKQGQGKVLGWFDLGMWGL